MKILVAAVKSSGLLNEYISTCLAGDIVYDLRKHIIIPDFTQFM